MLNICTTCISWEIGSYNTQQCLHMNIRTFVTILSRKAQCNFPKMRGGGVKSRLELFRKFILLLISGMRQLQWVPYVAWRGQPGLNMHLQARNSSCFLDHHHPLDVSLDVVLVKDISSRTTIRCGHKASKRLKLRVQNWSKYKS